MLPVSMGSEFAQLLIGLRCRPTFRRSLTPADVVRPWQLAPKIFSFLFLPLADLLACETHARCESTQHLGRFCTMWNTL